MSTTTDRTRIAPMRKRRNRKGRGEIWRRTALVAGNVAPHMNVVSSSAIWGVVGMAPLRLAERALHLIGGSCLLHRHQRPLLVRIIEPAPLPKIRAGVRGRHFGATVAMERDAIDGAGDVEPVDHEPGAVW